MASGSSKSAPFPSLSSVQESIRGLRSEGEKILTRGLKEAEKWVGKDGQKVINGCVSRARAIRKDAQKRADDALESLRSQTARLGAGLDARTRKSLEPIVRRLSVPTKHEVDQLAKRLSSLERKVDQLLKARS